MTTYTPLPEAIKVLARNEAQKVLNELTGVTAVVVATVDGFDIASVVSASVDAARIAAMASSISAISTVVSQEAGLGRNRSVTIDTESGFAMVYSVHRSDAALVINIFADSRAIVAQARYRTAEMARMLEQT